jgi:hypothetical protein
VNSLYWITLGEESLHLLALPAGLANRCIPVAIIAVPVMFPIFALFAGLPLGDIPVAIPAPPIVLPVIAPADQALGIIVIAIIAPPPVLFGAAPAGVALGGVPPVGWIVALPATFHVVACGVAVVAGGALPVVRPVVAALAGVLLLDRPVAVQTVPVHRAFLCYLL